MSLPKVAICIPTNGGVKLLTTLSLVLATNYLRAERVADLTIHAQTGPYTHWNREHLVNDAREADATHLMFVDTDIAFPADGIETLLSRKKDIIGAPYNLKQDEPMSTVKFWNDDRTEFRNVPEGEWTNELERVAALGTGFMLIDMRVFDGMEPPYFPCEYEVLGEDVAFCVNAQEAGFEVWCDPTVAVRHIGEKAY